MIEIPERFLNNNVRAMLSGRKKTFIQKPNFHINKVVSFLNRNYRVEVKIFVEKINSTNGEEPCQIL